MFFEIHEDKENFQSNRHGIDDRKSLYNVHNNKPSQKQPLENRKVLGHVTNTRYANISNRYPLALKPSDETVMDYTDNKKFTEEMAQIKKHSILDKPCVFISTDIYDVSSSSSTKFNNSEGDSSILDMSLGICSSLKKKLRDQTDDDCNEIIYTEPQYTEFIFEYLREAEHKHRPHPQYMTKQAELNDSMRCILVDWLVSISDEYELIPDTLYLAVSLIDRFLSKMSVVRTKFQLLGVTAMMIAAKYEEIHPPDILEFSSLTKDTCSVKQILKMEQLILRVLSFDLTTPSVQNFIEEYTIKTDISKDCINMAMLISELCLVESVAYLSYFPSEIAASSIALSRHTLEEDMWPQEYENVSGYSLKMLYPIVKIQHKVLEDSPNKSLQAVRTKFTKTTFRNVSRYTPRKLI